MKRLYKAVSVLMSLITVFSVFAIVPLEVSAAEGIEYIYRWWDSGAKGGSLNRFAMYGGTLTAVHGGSGAVIGGGNAAPASRYNGEGICFYGGAVDAKIADGSRGCGIGNGSGYSGTSPGSIAIYGGDIQATGKNGGAGIGGSKRAKDKGGYGGNITISSGSKVVATSSDYGEAQDLLNRLDGYIDHSGMKTDDIA